MAWHAFTYHFLLLVLVLIQVECKSFFGFKIHTYVVAELVSLMSADG